MVKAENLYEICVAVITQLIINQPSQLLGLLMELKKEFGSKWMLLDENKWDRTIRKVVEICNYQTERSMMAESSQESARDQ